MVHKYDEDDVLKKCPWCGVDAKLVTVHEKRISHYVCATCAKTVRINTR
jgi:transposase-like protein